MTKDLREGPPTAKVVLGEAEEVLSKEGVWLLTGRPREAATGHKVKEPDGIAATLQGVAMESTARDGQG